MGSSVWKLQIGFFPMIRKFLHLVRAAVALVNGTVDVLRRNSWKRCVCCDARVVAFLPWRGGSAAAPPLMRALEMVGSNLDHFACPRCGSTDRERHLRLYLEATGLADSIQGKRVLHFAPEATMTPWITSLMPSEHLLADLHPGDDKVARVNLEQMPYGDASFDVVIANHVLEHVANLDRAVSEISRVLKDDGWALLQVPWCRKLSRTIEDPDVVSPAARRELYGQEDHARLFGKDVFSQIGRFGLSPEPRWHLDVLTSTSPDLAGVNEHEPLMLFRRVRRVN